MTQFKKTVFSKSVTDKGSAFVYILIAIALLAALTASFMRPSSQQTTAQSAFNTVTKLKSQIEYVRSSIQECVLSHSGGDRGADGVSGLIGTHNTPYPINPSSTYLTSPAANDEVGGIRCPGDPGNSTDHQPIFSGSSGKYMPPPPELFEAWEYYSGTDGVFFFTRTDKTDAFLQTALQKLDEDYAECEADIITTSGSDIELTSTATAADPKCVDGQTCFRVWVIAQTPNIYPGDSDGDEAACP
jgi:hypothetical protein